MIPNRRSWMGQGFHQAALMLACLGLVLCASVNAQDTIAKQSDQPADIALEDTSACGCNSSGCNSCGPCGVGGYGVGGYGVGGYGTGGYGTGGYGTGGYGTGGYGTGGYGAGEGVAGGGAGGSGSFGAFGAAGGAGGAAPGAGAAPYMIGDLLMANRVINFNYARCASMAGGWWSIGVEAGAIVNIRNTKVAENNNAIPTDRFAYEYNYFKNGMSLTGISTDPEDYDFSAWEEWWFDWYADPWRLFPTKKVNYDVHVHTFTYEKTFWCGAASVAIRMPFAQGLSSDMDLSAGEITGSQHYADHDPADIYETANPYNALVVQPTPWNTWGECDWEPQDVSLIFKFLLHHDPCRERYISAGLQLTAPTARNVDISVTDFYGPVDTLLWDYLDTDSMRFRRFQIERRTWALSPFLAMTSKPTQRTFFNGFLQFDIPLGQDHVKYHQEFWRLQQNNPVINYGADPNDPEDDFVETWNSQLEADDRPYTEGHVVAEDPQSGDVADQTLLHLDFALGYYLYMNPCAPVLKAVIPTAEFHLTQTLSDPDRLVLDGAQLFQLSSPDSFTEPEPVIGNPADSNTITDVTVGVHTYLGQASMLSVGGVFPLGQGWDRTFDSEIAVKFNHSF